MKATSRDHVIPHSYITSNLPREFSRDTVVPCCKECNNLLNNLMYTTIATRAEYIAHALAIRHRKLLMSPDWQEHEYSELTGNLLREIRHQQTKKKVITARIEYAKGVAELKNLTPENVWDNI